MRHLRKILVAFTFAACIQPALAGAASGRILIPQKADVNGPSITLGEIAQFKGIPAAELKTIKTYKMGVAAPPGKSLILNRGQIKGRVYNAGINLDRYAITLPDSMTITTRAEIVTGGRIMDAAAAAVSAKLDAVWTGSPARVEIVKQPQEIVLPVGETQVEGVVDGRPNVYGPMRVHVEVKQGERLVRKIEVSSYMKVLVTVIAASHDMTRGTVLKEDDMQPVEVELSTLRPGVMATAESSVGKRLSRVVHTGDILLDSNVEVIPDVNTGELVQMITRGEGFEISMQVKALEKGRRGEIIRVLNVKSKKVLDARIIDSGSVELVNQ